MSFDIFTQQADSRSAVIFLSNETVDLFTAGYDAASRVLGFTIPRDRGKTPTSTFYFFLRFHNGSNVVLPVNTWVTIEVYIDYDNSEIYVSLPLQNYTIKHKLDYTLLLGGVDNEGNPLPDDSPVKLRFLGYGGINAHPNQKNPFRLRIDNINISGQNTVPTVNLNVNQQLAAKFNLYPNPATTKVNITNSENMLVNQITVYDIAGKQLGVQTFNNEGEIQLNIENLANGTYLLHIQTTEGTVVKKLVKK